MAKWHSDELIQVLSCEIGQRPDAPGPEQLAPFVTAATLTRETLVLRLHAAGREVAEAFVAAEQVCCSTIGWRLETAPQLTLRITAGEPQLKLLAGLVPSSIHIEEVQ